MAELLTPDLWALILQHVPLADRLKHCALVCKKLSKAAAAATSLWVSLLRSNSQEQQQQRAEAFHKYLQHHGSHVTSVVLDHIGSQSLTQLPCPKLLHLHIHSASLVQLWPHGNLPGVLGSATGLTSLNLSFCTVATEGGGLSGLSVLVKLRDLEMQYVSQPGVRYAALPGSVLPSLAHLTRLQLSNLGGVDDVHHVSSLTNLCVLGMRMRDVPDIFPRQATNLLRLTRTIAPGFVLPASLQQLRLGRDVVVDPAVLATATRLTFVELYNVECEVPDGGVSSGAALLAAVGALQQLDTLDLSHLEGIVWPAPSAAYTALTASSRLQKLQLLECGLSGAVWKHVFPSEHSCPALHEFGARGRDYDCWDAQAVSSLVRCCPGLRSLNSVRLFGGEPVAALAPLMSLTKLELFVDCTDDWADVGVSAQHLAALTSLQQLFVSLSVVDEGDVSAAALMPLTALKRLSKCDVCIEQYLGDEEEEVQGAWPHLFGNQQAFREPLVSVEAYNNAGPEQPPDVWLQVRKQCRKPASSQGPATAGPQAEQIASLQQQIAQLRLQHAARLTQQEQRMAQQGQQIAVLQQQVAAVPALQAQVQQLLQLLLQQQAQG